MKGHAFATSIAALLFGGVLLLGGCAKESPTKSKQVTEEDKLRAEVKVAEAEELWSTAAVIAGTTGEIPDFGPARDSYEQALESDPWNLDANFGASLTGILSLMSDPDIQALADCLEGSGAADSLGGLLDGGIGPLGKLQLHRAGTLRSSWRPLLKLADASMSCPPVVHELQGIVETKLIARVDYALEHLAVVESSPGFQYFLAPNMTGQADSMEVDLGEVYLLDASLNIAKSLGLILIAYNLDFDQSGTYGFLEDSTASMRQLKYLLEDSPTFLTLRPGKKGLAKQALLASLDKAEASLAFIRAETDDQGDDLIKSSLVASLDEAIVPGSPDMPNFARNFDRPEDIIAELRTILSGPYTITEDFDDNEETPDQSITVNVSALFDAPIQDLRKLFPYHRWEPETEWWAPDTVWVEGYPIVSTKSPFYFTDASGNRLDMMTEGFLFVLPDYTFGGLFPGMTRQRFEELIGPAGLTRPLAKRTALLSLQVPG